LLKSAGDSKEARDGPRKYRSHFADGQPSRPTKFYDRIFKFMGYAPVEVIESTQEAMKTRLEAWVGSGCVVSIRPSKGEFANREHDRNAPGLNHIAFSAEDRSDVERRHEPLKEMGAIVLDPPEQYPYSLGYYAVYFLDPDGLKFEFAYAPRP
jgi:glyoxylase I family protein